MPRTLFAILTLHMFMISARCAGNFQTADAVLFEKQVRPVLMGKCASCHGPEKQKSGLRVDSKAALLAGGESGPAIIPGNPDASLLLHVVDKGEPYSMPPKEKLRKEEILAIKAWIKGGAGWPGDPAGVTSKASGPSTSSGASLWSFKTPIAPTPPKVADSGWCRSPIDRFILAGLEARGMRPAPRAARHLLVRRATIDLTGLPPTPAEVSDFVNDESPDSFSRLVDRLLASPAYGERWGRHWLDLARYADSNGMDENMAHANAFRYRDWVIRAFNQDKPYDRFLTEQLAGDLLPAADLDERSRNITATGFLVIGPKMLAEDDPRKMEMDIVDEQLDTMGRAFLGMTFGCARCHDHKYDPVSTADYYALAGIFKSTKTMENFRVVAMWHERPVPEKGASSLREKALADIKVRRAELDSLIDAGFKSVRADVALNHAAAIAAGQWIESEKVTGALSPVMPAAETSGAIVLEAEKFNRGNLVRDFTSYGKDIGVVYNAGKLPNFAEYDFTTTFEGIHQIDTRHAAAETRPVKMLIDGESVGEPVAAHVTGSWTPETQKWNFAAFVSLKRGKHKLRIERNGPVPHFDKFAVVPRKDMRSTPMDLVSLAKSRNLPLGLAKAWVAWLKENKNRVPDLREISGIITSETGPFKAAKERDQFLRPVDKERIEAIKSSLAKSEKELPAEPMAMSASEGSIGDLKVHLRGNYLTLGKDSPRDFPKAIETADRPKIGAGASGRLELARWITQKGHPLTSRVLVNRVWHWHFGGGLVRTPDNFGALGSRPANQPLLDWLATEFEKDGWSIKKLHQRIMNTSTYQMSCAYDGDSFRQDPDNQLFWRMNRKRMEAEVIRDGVIFVAGDLDKTEGGSLMTVGNHKYVTSTASEKFDQYHVDRRTVYLPITRSSLYEFLQAFDFADPGSSNGERVTTTVAPQALALLNSRLMNEKTFSWARKLLSDRAATDQERIRSVFLAAYSRPPEKPEMEEAAKFITRLKTRFSGDPEKASLQAWQEFCRAILASSEFIHVD